MKTMLILRGPPGSGKSTVAKLIEELSGHNCDCIKGWTIEVLSLDSFRMVDGRYVFDVAREKEVVASYHAAVQKACREGTPVIILDNVHSRLWEFERTQKMGEEAGYQVFVMEVQADFWTCLDRMKHPVPFDKLREIFERWESWVRWNVQDRLDGLERLLYRFLTRDQK